MKFPQPNNQGRVASSIQQTNKQINMEESDKQELMPQITEATKFKCASTTQSLSVYHFA